MVIEDAGLSTDALTWAIFAAMTALWVFTARFCGKREDGWLAIPTSLLGAAWIGFALSFVVRFLVLSYDAITFGNFSDRLIARPASAVNETLVLAAVYWICLVLGHRSASSAFPGRASTGRAKPLAPRFGKLDFRRGAPWQPQRSAEGRDGPTLFRQSHPHLQAVS